MNQFRFRPMVAELEARENPSATPTEVFASAAIIEQHALALNWLANNLDSKAVFLNQANLIQQLPELSRASADAAATLSRFVVEAQNVLASGQAHPELPTYLVRANELVNQGLANQGYAASVALNLGATPADLLPPVPAPPPPPPPPAPIFDDSQLSTSIPDISEGFEDIGDGLLSRDVVIGVGDDVLPGQTVTVDYTGWLRENGTEFDSSISRGEPATFSLNQVIEGWQRGIPGMKPGGIRQLVIPAELGYGLAGSPPSIPPQADLVFEVRMRSATTPSPIGNNGGDLPDGLPPDFDFSQLFN